MTQPPKEKSLVVEALQDSLCAFKLSDLAAGIGRPVSHEELIDRIEKSIGIVEIQTRIAEIQKRGMALLQDANYRGEVDLDKVSTLLAEYAEATK